MCEIDLVESTIVFTQLLARIPTVARDARIFCQTNLHLVS